jgi:5'-methylthioadenosine phosphorylase
MNPKIGIIGGSGLYNMPDLTGREELRVQTPWGDPSDALVVGKLGGREVAFLARHGRGHRIMPSNLNFRANIYALKSLGVRWILSFSAVGSLRAELKPLDFCIPDQFVDRTRGRISTFFDEDIVVHVAFADPVCSTLADVAEQACKHVGVEVHRGGTYCCMEGPQFSTRAESNLYRSWGLDVIGMTNLQEAKLAREAEICYTTLALVTDYDCWHPDHESVTVEMVVETLTRNATMAQRVLAAAVERLPIARHCECARALASAIMTRTDVVPVETRARLGLLVDKYLR